MDNYQKNINFEKGRQIPQSWLTHETVPKVTHHIV